MSWVWAKINTIFPTKVGYYRHDLAYALAFLLLEDSTNILLEDGSGSILLQ